MARPKVRAIFSLSGTRFSLGNSIHPPGMKSWYCLRTKPKQEAKVAKLLEREAGLEVIHLAIRFKRMRQGQPTWFQEALFPGYVFSQFDYPHEHRQVRALAGVVTIVHFGDEPAKVPDDVVRELLVLKQANEVITVSPVVEEGSEVTIATGPLRGMRALVSRVMPARERIAILLQLLGAPREVQIETNRVLPANPRRAFRKEN